MATSVRMDQTVTHEQMARDYLAEQFGADAPHELTTVASFAEKALESEGAITIFAFRAARGDNTLQDFYVVAGETEPNYYPAMDLPPDDIYSLHLGTRFMLVLEIQQLAVSELAPSFQEDLLQTLARVAPGEPVQDFRTLAAFGMDGQKHAVCRLRLGPEEIYVLGGDLPLGIYRRVDLPPHVIYRLHLGKVIRMEEEEVD
jgi:hypothetical protein